MKTFKISILPALVIAVLAGSAAAQTIPDEARNLAAEATAAQTRQAWDHAPAANYRTEAQQLERILQWHASQRAVRVFQAEARSRPLAVTEQDSASSVSGRVLVEEGLAEPAAVLRSAAASQ